MKILFIQSNLISVESIGLMVLSAILKKNGYQTKLLYGNSPHIIKKVKEYSPEIIGYYITSGVHAYLVDLNKRLKKEYRNFFSIFGGPHATFFPEIIYKNQEIDAVNIGEGDISLLEFVRTIDKTGTISNTAIKNLWIRKEEEIIKNDLGNLITNLDDLPFYDRDLFQDCDHTIKSSGTRYIMFSRGCPYSCTYCHNKEIKRMHVGKGKILRGMSIKRAIQELEHALNTVENLRMFHFHDDEFFYATNNNAFEEFCQLYKEKINIPFWCWVPLRRRDERIFKQLKSIGCYAMGLGVESANEKIRKEILKRPKYSNQSLIEVSGYLKKYKIKFFTTNLVGLPIENSFNNDIETLIFNLKLKPTLALTYLFYPYPKTELAEYAVRNKFLLQSDIPYNSKADSLLNFTNENKTNIENISLVFGIIVSFPFLLRFHKFLLKLPKNILSLIYLIHRGYCFLVKMAPYFSLLEFKNNIIQLLKYISYLNKEKEINKNITLDY